MRLRMVLVAAAALVAVAALGAGSASAAISWSSCAPSGYQCGKLAVPLDRTGVVPGTVTLQVKRLVAASNPTRTAVVGLTGGPGQAAIPSARAFAAVLSPALADRDLLIADPRGTGGSSLLGCSAFAPTSDLTGIAAVQACASELGPGRGFYRSADRVADLEDLRLAAGYDKLLLAGISYGTKVALDYAAAYPDHTAGLLLDSVVPPEGSDPFSRSTFHAVGPVLAHVCARGACRGITAHPLADLQRVVARADRRALRGTLVLPSGNRVHGTVDPLDVFGGLLGGDLNPLLRAEMPGSVRSALRGDTAPILRLVARAAGVNGIPGAAALARSAAGDSDAVFIAARCEETAFPWDRAADPATRRQQAQAAADALPAADVLPFTPQVALRSDVIPLCLGWPNASPPPATTPPPPLPAVPTLILSGQADLRTPLADARRVQASIPGAHLVAVPDTGHSVLGSDLGTCAADAVTAFFAARPEPACRRAPLLDPTPVAPRSLAAVHRRGRIAKTLEALRRTVGDVIRQFAADAFAAGRPTPVGAQVGGLRSGSARVVQRGTRLRRVQYVPGVLISGYLPDAATATATFTVGGRSAAHGAVHVTGDGRVSGTLDGRSVHARFRGAVAASAARAAWARRATPPHPGLAGAR
jgi:pimeloyl-ACP methyl ester carboxylesterase